MALASPAEFILDAASQLVLGPEQCEAARRAADVAADTGHDRSTRAAPQGLGDGKVNGNT